MPTCIRLTDYKSSEEKERGFPLVPNVPVGNAYTSIGGNEVSVLIGSGVCIPKLELGNEIRKSSSTIASIHWCVWDPERSRRLGER
jgi:hypothetical protein